MFQITHPTAAAARLIENLLIKRKKVHNIIGKTSLFLTAKVVASTVFPIFITLELLLKRIPKCAIALASCKKNKEKLENQLSKVASFALGLVLSIPLGIMHDSDSVSSLFLKRRTKPNEIRPFGVENEYGTVLKENILYPKNHEEVSQAIAKARNEKKTISIIGAGMSQGTQTIPDENGLVIHTKHLNSIAFNDDGTVTAGSGASWEDILVEANKRGQSLGVKQASDIFSIGGSIGINCHGWAHQLGSLSRSSTIESVDVIDASGKLSTLKKDDPLFKCVFGTLGYFGVVVSAKIRLPRNEQLKEHSHTFPVEKFFEGYNPLKTREDVPLFGGRLNLDSIKRNPLSEVVMVQYDRQPSETGPVVTPDFQRESKYGHRIQRIGLNLFSHLTDFSAKLMLASFWKGEKKQMDKGRTITRNEAIHPELKAFMKLHASNLHTQWLQEYFVTEKELAPFLQFLGATLKKNKVRLTNATIRPTPKDEFSILPYAEQDRYAIVICFKQTKTVKAIAKTRKWINEVTEELLKRNGRFYQAYMPFATKEQFERSYGKETLERLRELKKQYDPDGIFCSKHTKKYYT